jgi:hypothetical protein
VRCPHTRCTRRCSEPCDRARCDVPCVKIQPCGHECIGLCGEPCPTLCRVCDADQVDILTQETLGESDADARFVQLECGHVAATTMLDGWMDSQDVAAADGGDAGEGEVIAGRRGAAAAAAAAPPRAIKLPACPECRSSVRRSFRYGSIVRRAIIELEAIKALSWCGPEFRASTFAGLDWRDARALTAAHRAVAERIMAAPRSATARVVHGELGAALASLAPERGTNAAVRDVVTELRSRAKADFEEALRLLGRDDRGGRTAHGAPAGAEPPLGLRDAAREAFIALRGIGLLILRGSGGGMAESAKVRLLAAKAAAAEAGGADGATDALDVDAVLADVASAERKAVESAIVSVDGGRGTWYTCPNGHRYVVGECGAGMELSRCPDCNATVGGIGHRMVEGSVPINGPSPYAIAGLLPPDPALIRRVQLG